MIKLHGVSASPFARKALACLMLKELDFEQVDVFPVGTPESFQALSPLKKIPALEDGKLKLADSSVICEYLEDKYPSPALYPKNAADKAKARWIEEYADSKLAEIASGIFFQRRLKPLIGQEADEEKVQVLIHTKLPEQYPYIESLCPENGFLFGDALMIADIALVTHFINAKHAGYDIDTALAPKFTAYFQRVCQQSVIQALLNKDKALFESLK